MVQTVQYMPNSLTIVQFTVSTNELCTIVRKYYFQNEKNNN